MRSPVVFTRGFRVFWLEPDGQLWTWSRVNQCWWWVRAPKLSLSGKALTAEQLTFLVCETGTPRHPRVTAAAPMPCPTCGRVVSEREPRTWLGTRGPFCSEAHRQHFASRGPVVDSQLTGA